MSTCQHAVENFFQKWGKAPYRAPAGSRQPGRFPAFAAGDCQMPEAGVWWLHSQGGVQVPTGGDGGFPHEPASAVPCNVVRVSRYR